MKRKKPSFNETYYGFRTFSHLLEEAQRKGIVTLRRDQKSGSYIVEDLGTGAGTGATTLAARGEAASAAAASAAATATAVTEPAVPLAATGTDAAEPSSNGARTTRRRRSRGRRPRGSSTGTAAGYPETPAAAGADDGADVDDHDDHEDIEDDAGHVEASEARRESGPAPEHGESTHDEPGAESPSVSPERAAAPPERPFSLFSWIRREAGAPSTPPAEPPKEDPER